MRIVVATESSTLAEWAAQWTLSHARRDAALALAVGGSVEDIYRRLAAKPGCLAGQRVFTIDELYRLDATDERCFSRRLAGLLAGTGAEILAFDPAAASPDVEADRVDRAARVGGLSAVVLGLGPNGHLALAEPGQPFDAPPRFVPFEPETLLHLGGPAAVAPATGGMTLPLATLLSAEAALLVVQGATKRKALERLIFGPLTTDLPASTLRLHPNATLITTAECLSDLLDEVLRLPAVEVLSTSAPLVCDEPATLDDLYLSGA